MLSMVQLVTRTLRPLLIIDEIHREIRGFNVENEVSKHDRLMKSIEVFSNEMNMRLSQETDSLMSMMLCEVNRAKNSAISERVIPELQNIVG